MNIPSALQSPRARRTPPQPTPHFGGRGADKETISIGCVEGGGRALPLTGSGEVLQRLPVQPRKLHQFDEVDAALSQLALARVGRGLPERLRHLGLRQSGVTAGLPKPLQESSIRR